MEGLVVDLERCSRVDGGEGRGALDPRDAGEGRRASVAGPTRMRVRGRSTAAVGLTGEVVDWVDRGDVERAGRGGAGRAGRGGAGVPANKGGRGRQSRWDPGWPGEALKRERTSGARGGEARWSAAA